jgi:hypothetical protein
MGWICCTKFARHEIPLCAHSWWPALVVVFFTSFHVWVLFLFL